MEQNILAVLVILFIALQGADYYTTKRIIERGGSEGKRIMEKMMERFGMKRGMLILKFPLCVLCVILAGYVKHPIMMALLGIGVGYYGCVVENNIKIFIRKKGRV